MCNVIKGGKVLNFNYTEFVEDLYGVDAENICYIHGCRKKTDRGRQRLILGHIPGANDAAYEFEDDYSAIDNLDEHAQLLYDVQQIALQMVVEADDTLTKKCKEIIQSNQPFFDGLADIRQIVTIGHSLYPVDWDYFAEIIKCNKDRNRMQWFFGCYGNGDLERVQTFINTFGINKDQVAIFRTDTIPVTLLADNKREKSKANVKHRKVLASSEDGKWQVVREGRKVNIIDRTANSCSCSRIFLTYMSGAVFDCSGTVLLLVARGLRAGVFFIPVRQRRVAIYRGTGANPTSGSDYQAPAKNIVEGQSRLVFVYNSRIRKYDVETGKLVYNKAVRHAFESEGEDLTQKFKGIYRTGFY